MRRDVSLSVQPEPGGDFVKVFRLTDSPQETPVAVEFFGQWIDNAAMRLIAEIGGGVARPFRWRLRSEVGTDEFVATMLQVDADRISLAKGEMPRTSPLAEMVLGNLKRRSLPNRRVH